MRARELLKRSSRGRAALERAAEQRVSDFNMQELANTAWAFATVVERDAQLFTALAREA